MQIGLRVSTLKQSCEVSEEKHDIRDKRIRLRLHNPGEEGARTGSSQALLSGHRPLEQC
jgi:hypothetical protein